MNDKTKTIMSVLMFLVSLFGIPWLLTYYQSQWWLFPVIVLLALGGVVGLFRMLDSIVGFFFK